MRAQGAELIEHGLDFQDAFEEAMRRATREGLHPMPSFHPELVRGVATAAFRKSARSLPAENAPGMPAISTQRTDPSTFAPSNAAVMASYMASVSAFFTGTAYPDGADAVGIGND